jgi:hypothetical protein
MMPIFVKGVGLISPGLVDWEQARPVLCGEAAYDPAPLPKLTPQILPANERRRATLPIRIALEAARQATMASKPDFGKLRGVFASADGDMGIVDRLCETVATDPGQMSPTLFHNSVHNAAAGYWSIGNGSLAATTSLSAGEGSFAAGLLEAWTQLASGEGELLLVAFDVPAPPPLAAHRPMLAPFGCALLLGSEPGNSPLAGLEVSLAGDESEATQTVSTPELEPLRLGNPAARALPLLEALARGRDASVCLPLSSPQGLQVDLKLGGA